MEEIKKLSISRLDFEDVMLTQPEMGSCDNDTLMVTQVDGVSTAVVPMTLCGTLTGQHSKSPSYNITQSHASKFSVRDGQELRSSQDRFQCCLCCQYVSLEDPSDSDHV